MGSEESKKPSSARTLSLPSSTLRNSSFVVQFVILLVPRPQKTKSKSALPQLVPSKPRRSGWTIAFWVAVIIIIGGTLGGPFGYAQTMRDRILPGVTIQAIPVGGLTRAEALARVQKAVDAYAEKSAAISINGASRQLLIGSLGVRFNTQDVVTRAYRAGRTHPLSGYLLLPVPRKVDLDLTPAIDAATFLAALQDAGAGFTLPVVEPRIAVVDGAATVVAGQAGTSIALDGAEAVLRAAADDLSAPTFRLALTTTPPTLAEEDLAEAKALMETMMSAPLTLTAPGKRFTVSPEQIADWLVYTYDPAKIISLQKEGIAITLDRAKAGAYLQTLHEKVGVPAKAVTGYEAEVLGEYAYKNFEGREIVLTETLDQMQIALQERAPRQMELIIGPSKPMVTMATATSPKPAGKVIAVDVTKQQLFAFEGGKLKFWTHVSTGLPGYDTPLGEWKVYAKTPKQWMIGQGYAIPNVKWVLPYYGDYTLHTAYWHDDFGVPKSHGCTNMSEQDAKWLFDWAEIGTPVVNFKS